LSVLWAGHRIAASPYSVVPYGAILALGIASLAVALVLLALGARRYFAHVGPRPAGTSPWRATARALHAAATLQYLRSAGVECTYPDEEASPLRRRLHQSLVGGLTLTLAATITAGIEQDLASRPPPYSLVSAPVLLGLVGGVAMLLGGGGLALLKRRADPAPAEAASQAADWAFLGALLVLAASGLLTLIARLSPAYGVLLALHLDAVFCCFVLAPFTKFAHVVYRFCSLVRDEEERAAEAAHRAH
jgi:citrate/tricarballylate utilization protein